MDKFSSELVSLVSWRWKEKIELEVCVLAWLQAGARGNASRMNFKKLQD